MVSHATRVENAPMATGKSNMLKCFGDEANAIYSTWDRIVWDGNICYVNGHYTDNNCTPGMFINTRMLLILLVWRC